MTKRETYSSEARISSWSAGSTALSRLWCQAMQVITFLIAARFLGPEDFGIFAIVLLVATGLTVLVSAGWREQAIIRSGLSSAAFFLALVFAALAGLFMGGLALSGYFLGVDRDVVLLAMMFSLSVPMMATSNFMEGIALRDGRVHRFAAGAAIAELVYLCSVSALLWAGYGLMSLGISRVVLGAMYLLGAFYAAPPPLPRSGSSRIRGRILRFYRGVALARFADYANSNAVTPLIGIGLGAASAGIYRAASRLVSAAFEVVNETSRTLAWRGVSSGGGMMTPLRCRFLLSAIWAGALPAAVWMALVGPDLVLVLLGSQWSQASVLIAILAFRRLALAHYGAFEAILSQSGGTRSVGRISLSFSILSVTLICVTMPFGLKMVAYGHLLSGVLGGAFFLREIARITGLQNGDMIQALWRPTLATCVMGVSISLVTMDLSRTSGVFFAALVGLIVYPAILFIVWPDARRVLEKALPTIAKRRLFENIPSNKSD